MPEETPKQKKIEEPWAVCGSEIFAYCIVKIFRETEFKRKPILWGCYSENDICEHNWDPNSVHRFDSPIKAIAYFKVHRQRKDYSKERTIREFLNDFPSERANLEKLLPKRFAQTSPKCTGKSSPPNFYDCWRQTNPRKAKEIDNELRRIDVMEPGYSEPND